MHSMEQSISLEGCAEGQATRTRQGGSRQGHSQASPPLGVAPGCCVLADVLQRISSRSVRLIGGVIRHLDLSILDPLEDGDQFSQ